MNELNRWFSSSFPYMLADGGKTLIRVDAVEAITESSDGGSIISLSGGNTIRCAASLRHPAGTLFTMVDNTEYVKKIDWSIEMYDGTDPSRVIVSSSQGIVCATSEFSHSRVSISAFEDDQQGMRDVLDLIILRTNH